jgi:hypothetical protein
MSDPTVKDLVRQLRRDAASDEEFAKRVSEACAVIAARNPANPAAAIRRVFEPL